MGNEQNVLMETAARVDELVDEVRELNHIVGAMLLGLAMTGAFPEVALQGALKDLATNDQRIAELAD